MNGETIRKFVVDEDNFNTFAGIALIAAEVELITREKHPLVSMTARVISAVAAGAMVAHVLPDRPVDYQPSYLPLQSDASF